jgi:uncharacterized protein
MFMQPSTKPLSQSELKQLSNFLNSLPDKTKAMSLTKLHGFLCALISAPDLVMPSKWQPVVFGGGAPEFESMEDAQKILGLLMQLNNQVGCQLQGKHVFEFLLWKDNKKASYENCSRDLLADWCAGYLQGIALGSKRVLSVDNADFKLLVPFVILTEVLEDTDKTEANEEKVRNNLGADT